MEFTLRKSPKACLSESPARPSECELPQPEVSLLPGRSPWRPGVHRREGCSQGGPPALGRKARRTALPAPDASTAAVCGWRLRSARGNLSGEQFLRTSVLITSLGLGYDAKGVSGGHPHPIPGPMQFLVFGPSDNCALGPAFPGTPTTRTGCVGTRALRILTFSCVF